MNAPPPSSSGQRDLFSDQPEQAFNSRLERDRRKRLGQFFTPYDVALFMAGWATGGERCMSILDPAMGLGVFFRAVLQLRALSPQPLRFSGCDIDAQALEEARRLLGGQPGVEVDFMERDYLSACGTDREKYDAILCNPPYIHFQSYKQRASALARLEGELGVSLGGLTNVYALFMLKSLSQLAPGGRAAYIVPSEFMNADYGAAVKAWLMQRGSLRYVVLLDYPRTLFPGALTTSCILLFANDGERRETAFLTAQSPGQLSALGERLERYPEVQAEGASLYRHSQIDPTAKWSIYYDAGRRGGGPEYKHLVPLSRYGKVSRGIATGCNAYFLLNEAGAAGHRLGDGDLVPCIGKASQVRSPFFTKADMDALRAAGQRVLLFNVGSRPGEAACRYIARGEEKGVHLRYLAAHRSPWYAPERRPPAPILIGTFSRNDLRFVRNEAHAYNLTSFHGFYPSSPDLNLDLLMAYLITPTAREVLAPNRRVYGGGLHKYEPNDLNTGLVLDLAAVPARLQSQALDTLVKYRESVLNGREERGCIEELDRLFNSLLTD